MADNYPREFGRYTLLAPLAQGGMGALYLACVGDRGLEKLCVVKTVLPHLGDPEYVALFRDEAKIVVRLSHGNLVPVFDAGLVQDELYLAMDYVEGKDLRAVWNRCVKKGIAFPIDVAVYIARELARGLHYAHNFGGIKLVHRDVAPPNVLVGFSGEVKLTDFGLASSTLKLEKTAAGIIYGKVSYMSPEQAHGELIDGRTDIYAAGIILWELLTGRQLFPQNQSDGTELIERVRSPLIDPPSVRAPRVPAALDQIVLRALARDPDERYLSGEQFRADLTAFLASNRDYVATDSERMRAFMKDLFDEDIERERRQRDELLETVHERLQKNQRLELAEREAARQRQRRKADILATIERKSSDGIQPLDGNLREGEIPGQVMEQLSAYDTAKMLGSVIERWKILRKIGEGGMGRVFEAEHTEIGRRVAIKILHPVYSRTPEVVARFRMEARAASRIGHPNIIEVTDSGTTVDGSLYFVMELLEGIELAERLRRETRLPIRESLDIAHQLAVALSAAHQNNIIHRDPKPENVFLINRDGNPNFVKVLDFGIAKLQGKEYIRQTDPGMAMGTPEYMAPEQAAGKEVDARSDIYSLGAILYEMLGGRAPFTDENVMEILIRKATEEPLNLSVLRPEAPVRAALLCMRMLSRVPEERPQTMAAVAGELSECLQELTRKPGQVPSLLEKIWSSSAIPSRATLRKVIGAVLVLDSELDAFCLDRFPSVKYHFTHGMDRLSKVNLLLELEETKEILNNLRSYAPNKLKKYENLLNNENPRVRQLTALREELDRLYEEKEVHDSIGKDTFDLDSKIITLRRQQRSSPQLNEGEILADRYRLVEVIGRGGFAHVWQAYDRKLKRLVAVKVLHTQWNEEQSRLERFSRGALKMATLQHPHIVRVFSEPEEYEGFHYFVMEYLQGGDLHRAVQSQSISLSQGIQTILQVGSGLVYSHRQGMIHRDVKPHNIILDGRKAAKLTDFDLVLAQDSTGGTRTGAMGTFIYASPEELEDAKQVDHRTDIYSLGMCLAFVVHGRDLPKTAFQPPDNFIAQLNCSERLREFIRRATSWHVENRYSTMEAFCEELASLHSELPQDAESEQAPGRSRAVSPVLVTNTHESAHRVAPNLLSEKLGSATRNIPAKLSSMKRLMIYTSLFAIVAIGFLILILTR